MDDTYKKLGESILSDITSDAPIANILLKAKVFAAKSKDKELLEWVEDELKGYKGKTPPEYRTIDACVKVDVHRGFQEVLGYTYPVDMIKDESIRKRLSHIPVENSITEIENMGKKDESGHVLVEVPTRMWYHHMRHCICGDIQRAYQVGSVTAVRNILVSVKSLLIDYFLKISENENIQFGSLIKKEATMTVNNINASIVNTGSGTVNAENITTVIGDSNTIGSDCIRKLREIQKAIDDLMQNVNNADYKELADDINTELNKEAPSKKVLKRCFQAIGGIVNGVVSGVIANQVSPLIVEALGRL